MWIKSTTCLLLLFVIKNIQSAIANEPISRNQEQRLRVISYATDPAPSKYLQEFSKKYDINFELIGVGDIWEGFNSKVKGFYNYMKSKKNEYNDNDIVLMLDAYDTVIICDEHTFLDKFNAYNADIVMSTGKECWPDPNLQQYLLKEKMSPAFKAEHPWFPWFICINSGAIMGRFPAMYSMLKRVRQLVINGNGSCSDFEGNAFSTNTQSDQRCFTTYYVEWLNNDQANYPNISIKLDHTHGLFSTLGAMLTYNYDIRINPKDNKDVTVTNKVTGYSGCVLHGNGPGVIIWRMMLKQIMNNGTLYFMDHLARLNHDFFIGWMDIFTIPYQKLSHYLSKKYKFDLGMHSTNFDEGFVTQFNICLLTVITIIISLCYIRCPSKNK